MTYEPEFDRTRGASGNQDEKRGLAVRELRMRQLNFLAVRKNKKRVDGVDDDDNERDDDDNEDDE